MNDTSITSVFVPVRLSSTRLPSKALRKLKGKFCIERLIERIQRAKQPDFIVLCTTTEPSDNELVDLAKKMGIKLFRGSVVDILERYQLAARKFNVKNIVNVDGDDIFCEPAFIDITCENLKKSDSDCIIWKNLPLGTAPVGIKTSALEKICSLKETVDTETGWTKFFTDTGMFQVKYLTSPESEKNDENIRLTLDYPEDLKLFEKIYENLNEPFSLNDILKLFRDKPELLKINENLKETYKKNFEKKSTKVRMKN